MMDISKLLINFECSEKPFQLVKHWDDVPSSRKTFPYWCEVKYDGVFCGVVRYNINTFCISRTGKQFYCELDEVVHTQVPQQAGVYIAELVNHGCSLETLSGLVNPNRVNPWTKEERELMKGSVLMFHDLLEYQEALNGYSARRMYMRRSRLLQALGTNLSIAQGKTVHSQAELDEYAQDCIDRGLEGIVIKNPEADYEAGHKGWRSMKIVRDLHIDLKCLDVETGKGKRTGQIARLKFEYKGKPFWADLGAGWTDEKRQLLTLHWQSNTSMTPVDKIFHISALQESSKGVLRLPKVNEMRIDKHESD